MQQRRKDTKGRSRTATENAETQGHATRSRSTRRQQPQGVTGASWRDLARLQGAAQPVGNGSRVPAGPKLRTGGSQGRTRRSGEKRKSSRGPDKPESLASTRKETHPSRDLSVSSRGRTDRSTDGANKRRQRPLQKHVKSREAPESAASDNYHQSTLVPSSESSPQRIPDGAFGSIGGEAIGADDLESSPIGGRGSSMTQGLPSNLFPFRMQSGSEAGSLAAAASGLVSLQSGRAPAPLFSVGGLQAAGPGSAQTDSTVVPEIISSKELVFSSTESPAAADGSELNQPVSSSAADAQAPEDLFFFGAPQVTAGVGGAQTETRHPASAPAYAYASIPDASQEVAKPLADPHVSGQAAGGVSGGGRATKKTDLTLSADVSLAVSSTVGSRPTSPNDEVPTAGGQSYDAPEEGEAQSTGASDDLPKPRRAARAEHGPVCVRYAFTREQLESAIFEGYADGIVVAGASGQGNETASPAPVAVEPGTYAEVDVLAPALHAIRREAARTAALEAQAAAQAGKKKKGARGASGTKDGIKGKKHVRPRSVPVAELAALVPLAIEEAAMKGSQKQGNASGTLVRRSEIDPSALLSGDGAREAASGAGASSGSRRTVQDSLPEVERRLAEIAFQGKVRDGLVSPAAVARKLDAIVENQEVLASQNRLLSSVPPTESTDDAAKMVSGQASAIETLVDAMLGPGGALQQGDVCVLRGGAASTLESVVDINAAGMDGDDGGSLLESKASDDADAETESSSEDERKSSDDAASAGQRRRPVLASLLVRVSKTTDGVALQTSKAGDTTGVERPAETDDVALSLYQQAAAAISTLRTAQNSQGQWHCPKPVSVNSRAHEIIAARPPSAPPSVPVGDWTVQDLGTLQDAVSAAAYPIVSQAISKVATFRSTYLGALSAHAREVLQPAVESMTVGLTSQLATLQRLQADVVSGRSAGSPPPVLADLWSAAARSETPVGDAGVPRAAKLGKAVREAVQAERGTAKSEDIAYEERAVAASSVAVMALIRAFGTFAVSLAGQLQAKCAAAGNEDVDVPADELRVMVRTASSMAQDQLSMALCRVSRWRQAVLGVAAQASRLSAETGVRLLQMVDSNTGSASRAYLLAPFACQGGVPEANEIDQLSKSALSELAGRVAAAVTPSMQALEDSARAAGTSHGSMGRDVVSTVRTGLRAAKLLAGDGVEKKLGHIETVARQNNPRAAVAVGPSAGIGSTAALAKAAALASCPPDVGGELSPLASSAARSDLDKAVAAKVALENSAHMQAAHVCAGVIGGLADDEVQVAGALSGDLELRRLDRTGMLQRLQADAAAIEGRLSEAEHKLQAARTSGPPPGLESPVPALQSECEKLARERQGLAVKIRALQERAGSAQEAVRVAALGSPVLAEAAERWRGAAAALESASPDAARDLLFRVQGGSDAADSAGAGATDEQGGTDKALIYSRASSPLRLGASAALQLLGAFGDAVQAGVAADSAVRASSIRNSIAQLGQSVLAECRAIIGGGISKIISELREVLVEDSQAAAASGMFPAVPRSSEELEALSISGTSTGGVADADVAASLQQAARGLHASVQGATVFPLTELVGHVASGIRTDVAPIIGSCMQAHVACALAVIGAVRKQEMMAASECVAPLVRLRRAIQEQVTAQARQVAGWAVAYGCLTVLRRRHWRLYRQAWQGVNPGIPANPNAVQWGAGAAEGIIGSAVAVVDDAVIASRLRSSLTIEALPAGKWAVPRLLDPATQVERASDRARVGRELADARARAIVAEYEATSLRADLGMVLDEVRAFAAKAKESRAEQARYAAAAMYGGMARKVEALRSSMATHGAKAAGAAAELIGQLGGLEGQIGEFYYIGATLLDGWSRRDTASDVSRSEVGQLVHAAFQEALQDSEATPYVLQAIERAAVAACQRVDPAGEAPLAVLVGLHLRACLEALVDVAIVSPLQAAGQYLETDGRNVQTEIDQGDGYDGADLSDRVAQLQATLQASRAHLIAAARSPDAVLAAGARTSLQIASYTIAGALGKLLDRAKGQVGRASDAAKQAAGATKSRFDHLTSLAQRHYRQAQEERSLRAKADSSIKTESDNQQRLSEELEEQRARANLAREELERTRAELEASRRRLEETGAALRNANDRGSSLQTQLDQKEALLEAVGSQLVDKRAGKSQLHYPGPADVQASHSGMAAVGSDAPAQSRRAQSDPHGAGPSSASDALASKRETSGDTTGSAPAKHSSGAGDDSVHASGGPTDVSVPGIGLPSVAGGGSVPAGLPELDQQAVAAAGGMAGSLPTVAPTAGPWQQQGPAPGFPPGSMGMHSGGHGRYTAASGGPPPGLGMQQGGYPPQMQMYPPAAGGQQGWGPPPQRGGWGPPPMAQGPYHGGPYMGGGPQPGGPGMGQHYGMHGQMGAPVGMPPQQFSGGLPMQYQQQQHYHAHDPSMSQFGGHSGGGGW